MEQLTFPDKNILPNNCYFFFDEVRKEPSTDLMMSFKFEDGLKSQKLLGQEGRSKLNNGCRTGEVGSTHGVSRYTWTESTQTSSLVICKSLWSKHLQRHGRVPNGSRREVLKNRSMFTSTLLHTLGEDRGWSGRVLRKVSLVCNIISSNGRTLERTEKTLKTQKKIRPGE